LEDIFTAGLRVNGLTAPFVLDGPMDGKSFWIPHSRVPDLQRQMVGANRQMLWV
jgi:hypothetical protein